MKHIKGLDTLRAFAVIFVIIEHWWLPIEIDEHKDLYYWIKGLVPDGGFGVDLFFVLSGYLITSILLNAVKTNPEHKLRIIKNFIIRRALRIFPIYYLSIIILMLIKYPFIQDNLSYFILYISNIQIYQTGVFNEFSHTWSLSVEEQFYLFWPWLIVFIKDKFLNFVFLGSIAIGLLVTLLTMKVEGNWTGGVLMPSCMQAFGIGGLYAYLIGKGKRKVILQFLSFAVPISLFLHFYWALSPDPNKYNYWFLTVNSIISVWLIHKVLGNKTYWVKRFVLENRVLNKIGEISYGIYLFHFVMHFVYEKIIKALFSSNPSLEADLLEWKNAYFIKLSLLFLLALGSFHLIEKPILRLKNKFNY